eukprot:440375-Rhodomonas_salina.1
MEAVLPCMAAVLLFMEALVLFMEAVVLVMEAGVPHMGPAPHTALFARANVALRGRLRANVRCAAVCTG